MRVTIIILATFIFAVFALAQSPSKAGDEVASTSAILHSGGVSPLNPQDDRILIVLDSEGVFGGNYSSQYEDSFDRINYTDYEVVTSAPDYDEMVNYEFVFWTTFDDWWTNSGFNATNQSDVSAFLDEGDKFFMLMGQDAIYGSGFTAFYTDYLGVDSVTEDVYNNEAYINMSGASGTFCEGISGGFMASILYSANNFYSDDLTPTADAMELFITDENYTTCVAYDSGTFKTSFATTEYGCADGDDLLDDIMLAHLQWFGMSPTIIDSSSVGVVKALFK
ncbi:MAG TPA: hypothetical protein ENG29_00160 [Firmicutes bacterium]|uniref:Gingipain domain-containing protein n=1 Tax=Candidatus Coatesbacteria bacterium 4484_99 TaxID=1970774 RepID=A0A1W9S020_9BACT|nr:MAG: hypothetical protein B6D57_04415 [Candidatus Coatesbacteria bacterium 4484_99]RLC38490.1 MAG: hypothetical protein DRH51_08235 [Candidatus Coatesbacteria bacterium]RLC40960.1 MAG: hypothetical protein DRH49_06250 [Candidatus Coatesbacteria bacterium]RLC44492.1 MAG: hypothetical protein DRH44_02150 [Candidatus Coatesbacteria bacterium]HDM42782.1 hypothetical protein [Bacillota bacterium]